MSEKKGKKFKSKGYKAYYHEAADRISLIQNHIEDNIRDHPALQKHKKLQKKIDDAQSLLWEVYQKIAKKI